MVLIEKYLNPWTNWEVVCLSWIKGVKCVIIDFGDKFSINFQHFSDITIACILLELHKSFWRVQNSLRHLRVQAMREII